MVRPRHWQGLFCVLALAACGVARAAEGDGQALLDKAIDTKVAAENAGDLNEVIKLCEQAIKAGLDEGGMKFANSLLASTLSQRAELVCGELFERPVTPGRARKLVQIALADLEQTIKIDANQAQAQYLLGRLYAHMGEGEKALKSLNEAVRLSEDDPAMKSKTLLVRANVQPEPAARQADYDEAVKLTPRDPDVLRFRGLFYLSQGNVKAAIADLDAAIEVDPKDAETHEARGVALARAERYDDALASFNKALELEPNAASAYAQRARIRAIKNDLPAALEDVERALKLQPGSVQALHLHATLLSSMGKFEAALADLNLLRRAMPDSTEVLLQIAMVYQASKQTPKAINTYAQVLEADGKNVSAYRGRADAYLSQGKQAQAVADYEAALKIDPKNSGVLNNLAWLLATSPEKTLRDGKRAIELAKLACEETEFKQAHILSTLAAGYAETGDFDTAITWSKKAVDLGDEAVKPQLSKELESYQEKKPWREEIPPAEPPAPQKTAQPDKGAAPANEDTARTKRD